MAEDADEEAARERTMYLLSADTKPVGALAMRGYLVRDKKIVEVAYMPRAAQKFDQYATAWEEAHSAALSRTETGKAFPFMTAEGTVIGYIGAFPASAVMVKAPGGVYPHRRGDVGQHLALTLEEIIKTTDVIADRRVIATTYGKGRVGYTVASVARQMYENRGYVDARPPNGREAYQLLTDPDGNVVQVLATLNTDLFVESTWDPLDLLGVVEIVYLVGKAVGKRVIFAVAKGLTARRSARSAAREIDDIRLVTPPPVPAPVKVNSYRKVSEKDLLRWEEQNGHLLQRHNPLLTRDQLKSRITGIEKEIPAPAAGARDLRVWQGQTAGTAASRWASDDALRDTLSELIDKNVATIRKQVEQTGRFEISANVGRKTGEGYVVTGGAPKADRAMFYMDSMEGATIVFRRKEARFITEADPEIWYVLTAYPNNIAK